MAPTQTKRKKGKNTHKRRKKKKQSRANNKEIILTKPNHSPKTKTETETETETKTKTTQTGSISPTKHASFLPKARGKAEVKPSSFSTTHKHLTEESGADHTACLAKVYPGFVVESLEERRLREQIGKGLKRLAKEGYFHYDIVQYGKGKGKLNSTRVQRILVGKPGITYLYQNLRLFAFSWEDESISDGALTPIRELSQHLERRSKWHQERKRRESKHVSARAGHGRCDFNLTLINASNVEPGSERVPQQQHVPLMNTDFAGNVAVNWHRDSTLVENSTIAVYNHTPVDAQDDWRIAMRPYDGNNAPAVSVRLKDNDCYFMLGDFNKHHVHAVLAGKTTRFASTHRVALQANATYAGILARTENALAGFKTGGKRKRDAKADKAPWSARTGYEDAEAVRSVGETLNVLEFDWIRQFYIQGGVHAHQHKSWWTPRIETLGDAWERLEAVLATWVESMLDESTTVPPRALNMAIYVLQERLLNRSEWAQRYKGKLYRKMPQEFRPVDIPLDVDRFANISPAKDLKHTLKLLNRRVSAKVLLKNSS